MASESLAVQTDVGQILRQWDEEQSNVNFDPVPILTRLAEIIEVEAENYLKMDPDPFDERHPSRTDPDCNFGHVLKVLFRKENFMTKLINDYLRDTYYSRLGITNRDVRILNTAACRLMLDILPGLETSAVFQPDMDGLILRLFGWVEKANEPLTTYATGLLAAAMEVQDIATSFRDHNGKTVPLMLQRLHELWKEFEAERKAKKESMNSPRPFAHLGQNQNLENNADTKLNLGKRKSILSEESEKLNGDVKSPEVKAEDEPPLKRIKSFGSESTFCTPHKNNENSYSENAEMMSPPSSVRSTPNRSRSTPLKSSFSSSRNLLRPLLNNSNTSNNWDGNSNSSWAEMESYVIGTFQIYPPTLATKQILILRYLSLTGEYQEFLAHSFEQNALDLILKYINMKETKESRLAFEALRYLASLLCHKKFSIEFLSVGDLQKLFDVPRPSVAATGVSICLYYLAYCEDAMERVCLQSKDVISKLVAYALWLLECSHDSGRCHATMFFGFTFPFKVILDEFDKQDGLRKLFNVISTLPILTIEEETILNDDDKCASRQIVRHVTVALKRYMESHLYLKAEQLKRAEHASGQKEPWTPSISPNKPCKLTSEEVQEKIEILQELMSLRANWHPVEELYRLGGITLLLKIIAFAREWNYTRNLHTSSIAETVKSCLDIIGICSVVPKVMLLLSEKVDVPDIPMNTGITLLLAAADCEIVADSDVQRAALRALVNCVCAPLNRTGGNLARYSITGSTKKKTNIHNSEELVQKIWESVRSNNGIMILLQLMLVKTPITDADSIRALACRALAGLARSEKVRQIISQLPMFTEGQIQALMKDPILQEKRQEHVTFQKHALDLLECVSGKTKPTGSEYEISLVSLHRANVVAQTRIQYNDKQLYQLIYQHLMSKGLTETAAALQREASLESLSIPKSITHQPFHYRSNATANIFRDDSVGPRTPGTPVNLYNSIRGTARDTPNRNAATPPSTNRFMSHPNSVVSTPVSGNASIRLKLADTLRQLDNSTVCSNHTTQPIKLQLMNKRSEKQQTIIPSSNCSTPTNCSNSRSLQKQISRDFGGTGPEIASFSASTVTLDSIITEYLINQHALCKNPMVTCPQFNLFEPHKCPDPCSKNSTPTNFVDRFVRRPLGFDGRRLDRRYIYSRFCPVKCLRPSDVEGTFTCCTFTPCQEYLILGTYAGDVKVFNVHSGAQEYSFQCHESFLFNVECNKKGNLLLTSTAWRSPMSALWSFGQSRMFIDMNLSLDQEDYAEFSKLQDRIIGTQAEVATIYDIATCKLLMTLTPSRSNLYTKNRATFSMNDELVLSDGILWDVNSGKEIHKFDKLNQTLNGVFHPNGTEVVSNTEVWDLRTFHLLKTVPTLDQMEVIFSPVNNIIYAVSFEQENNDETQYVTSFKTLDALDYSSIATHDTKKGIYDLACNKFDTQIAIVENLNDYDSIQESCVRLYDVGRKRDKEDEQEEDDDEEEDDDDLDNSDDDGSNSGSNSLSLSDNASGPGDDDNGDDNDQLESDVDFDDNNSGDRDRDESDSSDDNDSDSEFSLDLLNYRYRLI